MKILLFVVVVLLVLACPLKQAWARTLTVAVIDTGIDPGVPHQCKMGNKSFVGNPKDTSDKHGHGSHIAGLINQNAGGKGYCLVALKFYSDNNSGSINLRNEIAALRYAINIRVDFINISGGGPQSNPEEQYLIKKALDKGIKVIVAAGNESDDLGMFCNYFPACYDPRLVVVGNLRITEWESNKTERAPSSNYGPYVNRWEVGTDLRSSLPGGKTGLMSGTSQATAVTTGKLIRQALK
jgi:major intracellular serine protease